MKHAQTCLFDNIEDLEARRRTKLQRDAETLEQLAVRAGLPPDVAADLAMNLRPAPKADWIFVMISPQQNAAVVQWLEQNSKRPMKAMKLWAELFTCMRMDTGEILRSRDETGGTGWYQTANLIRSNDRTGVDQRHCAPTRRAAGQILHEPQHRHAHSNSRTAQGSAGRRRTASAPHGRRAGRCLRQSPTN